MKAISRLMLLPSLACPAGCKYFKWPLSHPFVDGRPGRTGSEQGTLARGRIASPQQLHQVGEESKERDWRAV